LNRAWKAGIVVVVGWHSGRDNAMGTYGYDHSWRARQRNPYAITVGRLDPRYLNRIDDAIASYSSKARRWVTLGQA